jgi:hypothetical protein
MKTTLIITESQRKMILTESIVSNFAESVKNNYEFVKKIIREASESMGMNLQFAITWGASIGGFIGPINDFLTGQFPELSEIELSLILTGVIATYYFDNSEMVKNILEKIKEEGLYQPFREALKKGKELKETFLEFVSSLNITLHKITNMMSYTFILPLIPMIYEIAKSGDYTDGDIKQISLRLASFGILTVSGIMIRELLTKLINRFKS